MSRIDTSNGDSSDMMGYKKMLDRVDGILTMPDKEIKGRVESKSGDVSEYADLFAEPATIDAQRLGDNPEFDEFAVAPEATEGADKGYDIEVLDDIGQMFDALKHQGSSKRLDMFQDVVDMQLGQNIGPDSMEDALVDEGYSKFNVENNLERYVNAGLITSDLKIDGPGIRFSNFVEGFGPKVARNNYLRDVESAATDNQLDEEVSAQVGEYLSDGLSEEMFTGDYNEEVSEVFQKVAKLPEGGNRLKIFMNQAERPDATYDELTEDTSYQPQSASGILNGMRDVGLLDQDGQATDQGREIYALAHDMHQDYSTLRNINQ